MISGLVVNQVYLATGFTDMRNSINGLSLIVSEQFGQNPFNSRVFVFSYRSCGKLKILYWECNGFWLYYRRLDKGKFQWPTALNEQTLSLTLRELHWLLDGLSYQQVQAHTAVSGLKSN